MRVLLTSIILSLLPAWGSVALDANGTIQGRQALMAYIGSNMRSLSGMARGDQEYNAEYVRAVGQAIAAISAALPHLFPEGTGKDAGRTEADQAIFDDPNGFAAVAAQLGDAARAVSASADSGAFAEAFPALAGTCRTCHSVYRSR